MSLYSKSRYDSRNRALPKTHRKETRRVSTKPKSCDVHLGSRGSLGMPMLMTLSRTRCQWSTRCDGIRLMSLFSQLPKQTGVCHRLPGQSSGVSQFPADFSSSLCVNQKRLSSNYLHHSRGGEFSQDNDLRWRSMSARKRKRATRPAQRALMGMSIVKLPS